ncbi:MAG: pre-peptidase C-terminal domain-containing protein [Anaerolineae bacterium]
MAGIGRVFGIVMLLLLGSLPGMMAQAEFSAQETPTPTAAVATTPVPAQTLVDGVPVTIQLVGGAGPVDLLYTAPDAQTVTVTARSETAGAIDTTLQVLSADNENLGFNDDHETRRADLSNRDSVIEDLELPSAGVYIIRVDSFTGASTGNVEVTLDAAGRGAVGDVAEPVVISDRLRRSRTYETTFEGNEGDVVTITARDLPDDDADIDPLLTLLNEDGDVLAENDDHENRDTALDLFDARIENFVLPEDGTYTIEVDEYFGDPGDFELTINFATSITEALSGPLEIEGNVPANGRFEQVFTANEGDVVTITVRADSNSDLDPILRLLDAGGETIAENDDHASEDTSLSRYDSQIAAFTIPANGRYLVVVTGFGTSSGDFRLTIEFGD